MGLPGTYTRVSLHFKNNITGSVANVALWYLIGAGPAPTLSTVATFANAFRTAFVAAIPPSITSSCAVNKVTVKYVAGGAEVEGDNTNGALTGAVEEEALPEEDVAVIQRRTGLVGRNKRGRVFWPYVPESFQQDGDFNGTALTAYAAVALMIKSNVVSGATTFNPHTPDWKNSVLVPVVQTGYLLQVCSRRDRRAPKVLEAIHV